tara:strand:- start:46 stop:2034 length:1989 start_codon:yes stop_codon:yes gene_type:complete
MEVMSNLTEKEGDSKPLSDKDKQKMRDMGLVWKGKGYGKEGEEGILFKNVDGKLVKTGDKKTTDKPEKVKGQDLFKKDVEKEKEKKDAEKKTTTTEIKSEPMDTTDDKSDNRVKMEAIEKGYVKDASWVAPGNAGSMYNEMMSGEAARILKENPNASDEEIACKLLQMYGKGKLSKQQKSDSYAGGLTKKRDGEQLDKINECSGITNKGLLSKTLIAVRSGRKKQEMTKDGIKTLQEKGLMGENVTTRDYSGQKESLEKMKNLIEGCGDKGKYYTRKGDEISKEELLGLIENSGKGDNPSDTATIAMDDNCKGMVMFHSDKMQELDIQANSTPNKEYDKARERVDETNMSDADKKESKEIITEGQDKLNEKEKELKDAVNKPAEEMSEMVDDDFMNRVKTDTDIEGNVNTRTKASTKLKDVVNKDGSNWKHIQKYLPENVSPEEATEKEIVAAFYKWVSDPNREGDPTGNQMQFLLRTAKQNGFDVSGELDRIRRESVEIQRETLKKLNEKSITLPNGDKKPLGSYLEAKNLISQLHLDSLDGEKGVHKHPGLFNVNMGGTIVDEEVLKECLGVNNTDEFVENFEVGTPEEGQEYIYKQGSKKTKVTGRRIFVYAIIKTKDGKTKKVQIAEKQQRPKQGQVDKLSTTYTWSKEMADCFKDKQ